MVELFQQGFLHTAEMLGGIFAGSRGELSPARDPDLRCLSALGVGSEVGSDVRGAALVWEAL